MAVETTVVRGRMDAVFAEPTVRAHLDHRRLEDRCATPRGADAEPRRCSWPRIGSPGQRCPGRHWTRFGAAFHYVRSNETVTPVDLLDADGLRRLIAGAESSP